MRRRVWLALGSTVGGFILVGSIGGTASASGGSPLVNETFTASTVSQPWELPAASVSETNDACLTTAVTPPTPIPVCSSPGPTAGLQLTPSATQQEGGVAYSSSVPSQDGLDVHFTTYQYDGSTPGADGINFFLAASSPTDASATPVTLGPPGGYLGYSADVNRQVAGLTHGYLGVGLDVFGNYTSTTFDGSGCTEAAVASTPESIDVRGPGSGTAGYCEINTAPAVGTLDTPSAQQSAAVAVPVEVVVNPTSGSLTTSGTPSITVPTNSYVVQVTPVGGSAVTEMGPLPDATGFDDASWLNSNGVPSQLSFGWSASTGASTDYHTITDVGVQTLAGTPTTFGVSLADDSGGSAYTGATVNYTATTTLSGANEADPTTLTDTFPTGLTPQSALLGGTGWSCGINGQTVTCTYPPASIQTLPVVRMPVKVSLPLGTGPTKLTDTAIAGAPDGTQGSNSDTESYSSAPLPTATVLGFVGQPVNAKVNVAMTNANNTTTHIQVAAEVTPGGATDSTYTGPVTLGFANNSGGAKFVYGGAAVSTITVNAVAGVADFSPIVVNAVGFGYTLSATAAGLTSATSTSFDVNAATTTCPSGQTCTVQTTSPSTGQSAQIQALGGSGSATITATYGGNVAPIHPCTGAVAGILTFSGDRQKVITLTIPLKSLSLLFCYGQPTPFLDITYRPTTFYNTINKEYEGLLPLCLPKFTGPCVKSLSLSRTAETVVIDSGTADPRVMT